MCIRDRYNLPQNRIPLAWYNVAADLPKPMAPVLHPGTLKPIGPDDLAPLFPMSLIMQEVSTEREIEIPGEVRQLYAQWRPSPLYRARRLEKALDTPAHIYYKYEGVSAAGSHKLNKMCIRDRSRVRVLPARTPSAVARPLTTWTERSPRR